jgi:hypothetical protein
MAPVILGLEPRQPGIDLADPEAQLAPDTEAAGAASLAA